MAQFTMTAAEARTEAKLMTVPYFIRELFRREPIFSSAALGLIVLMLPTALAIELDARTLFDINVWIKPLKFQIALSVYLITLAWFAGWLPEGVTEKIWYRVFSCLVIFCIAAEMIWIGGAAAHGVGSHFNVTPPFMGTLYGIMGILAAFLTSATLLYAWFIWRNDQSRLHPVLKLSVVFGLVLTFVLTVVVGFFMASQQSHFVGWNVSDAEGALLMGWARDGGDLRVAHFFGTHAMHFIPFVGLFASYLLPIKIGRLFIMLFTIAFTVFVGFTLVQALREQPFLAGWL